MMLFKLSIRNLRKSIRNYVIYFATLILGVAIFYVFNALGSQSSMLAVSNTTLEIISYLNDTMSVVSVFVSFVLGFLVVYASTFLMKRRKKEFGIYMLLGMSKSKISFVLLIETIIIGLVSLGVGLAIGIAASQGMSIVVANMFEADMTSFEFIISRAAVIKTLGYFLVMYIIVMALNLVVVGKARLINLINAAKRSQRNHAKNPIVCILVFIVACILLGTAYYRVSAGIDEIRQLSDLGIQVAKGIIGTFMFFWSLSGLLITVIRKNKKFYYKGLNCFSTKELSSRINTTVFSGGIICLLLFLTICILSSAVSIKRTMDASLEYGTPMDVQFIMYYGDSKPVSEWLEEYEVDMSSFEDSFETKIYTGMDLTKGELFGNALYELNYDKDYIEMVSEFSIGVITQSQYNILAENFNFTQYELSEDEYIIVADFKMNVEEYNAGLELGNTIDIAGKELKPKFSECQDGYLIMENTSSNDGFVIVPDSVDLSEFEVSKTIYSANFTMESEAERNEFSEYLDSYEFENLINPDNSDKDYAFIAINTRKLLYDASIGVTAISIFLGIYLGIVFLISSAAILALKELSEAADSKDKYQILRRIGVDEKQISRSLMSQCGVFFGLPLALAIVHSIFGIQTAMFILQSLGKVALVSSIIFTAVLIMSIYGIYFWITYACSRKIISE